MAPPTARMTPRIGRKLAAALAIQALVLGVVATGAQATSPGPPPGCAQASVIVDNTTPVPITDFGTVFSTNTVSSQNLVTLDVDVKTFISHTNSTELDIFLTSPTGTQVTLT
ncbi:MAG: proprotein convertase P-domain-containing protein, partial [Actinomycetota bacterium]